MENLIVELIITGIIVPVIIYIIRSNNNKMENLFKRMTALETKVEREIAVTDVEIVSINDKLKEIKRAVEKIADKL